MGRFVSRLEDREFVGVLVLLVILNSSFPRFYFPTPSYVPLCFIVVFGGVISWLAFVLMYFASCALGFILLASSGSIIHFPKGQHPLYLGHTEESSWVETSGVRKRNPGSNPCEERRKTISSHKHLGGCLSHHQERDYTQII